MSMKNVQLLEFVDRFPVKEYRISDEKIETRILDGGSEQASDWRVVSTEQLSSHVKSNTALETIDYFLRRYREEVIRKRKAVQDIEAQLAALEAELRSQQSGGGTPPGGEACEETAHTMAAD